MLNGGGINPDGLSLDLQFAADKTLTARRGPTPVFTRGSTGTFVGSNGLIQSAAINEPRFDHDPVTLACKGLLIEEGRTNLLSRSAEFENSAWSRAAVGVAAATITPNSDIAPDGTTTADTANFSATTATSQQGMLFRTDLTATIGQVVTFSVYMRVPSGTATVYIGLSEGSPITGQSVACNVTTTWQRFNITRTAAAATLIYTQIGPDTRSFAGQPAVQPAASVFLWGAQLEVGSFPTSYIPTTTGSVVRSADVCSITGSDFTGFYNQSEGTAVTKVTNASGIGSLTQYPFSFSGSSATELLIVYRSGSAAITPRACRFGSVVLNNDTLLDSPDAGVFADNAISIAGFAIKLNNFAGSLNGNLITDTTVSLPAVDRMFIGNRVDGTRTWNGHIAYIRYFKKRLPDAKLAQLTA